jgi:hypothetical protein
MFFFSFTAAVLLVSSPWPTSPNAADIAQISAVSMSQIHVGTLDIPVGTFGDITYGQIGDKVLIAGLGTYAIHGSENLNRGRLDLICQQLNPTRPPKDENLTSSVITEPPDGFT